MIDYITSLLGLRVPAHASPFRVVGACGVFRWWFEFCARVLLPCSIFCLLLDPPTRDAWFPSLCTVFSLQVEYVRACGALGSHGIFASPSSHRAEIMLKKCGLRRISYNNYALLSKVSRHSSHDVTFDFASSCLLDESW